MLHKIGTSSKIIVSALVLVGCGANELPQAHSSSCSGTGQSELAASTASQSPEGERSRELVLRFYQEFDSGKLDEFEAFVAPEFEARVMGTQTLDWDGFEEFGGQFLTGFPDGRHEFDRVVVDGDTVVTVGHYRGTHNGELMGMSATGRRLDLAVMHLDRVLDGKIVEHVGIANGSDLMRQLGPTPAER